VAHLILTLSYHHSVTSALQLEINGIYSLTVRLVIKIIKKYEDQGFLMKFKTRNVKLHAAEPKGLSLEDWGSTSARDGKFCLGHQIQSSSGVHSTSVKWVQG